MVIKMQKISNIIFAIIVLLFALPNLALANKPPEPEKIIGSEFYSLNSMDYVYGKDDAPIQVLEYFSLTCPHCSYFYENIFPKLKEEYIDTGKVKWIKRPFILDHASMKGSMLMACIDKNNYESYLKILLIKQANWAYQKDFISVLSNIASLGGMGKKKFDQCMNDKKTEQAIHNITIEARDKLKISGTPSFYINNEYLTNFSYEAFRDHFDKMLKKK